LYVDRRGDGDLTRAENKVAAKKVPAGDPEESFEFEAGELAVGGKTHKGLRVILAPLHVLASNLNLAALPQVAEALKQNPNATTGRIDLDVECDTLRGGGIGGRVSYLVGPFDLQGVLLLAATPAEAPRVYLDALLQITFCGSVPTWRGGRVQDTVLCVGTPGRGPGTFAMLKYENTVPPESHPRLDVTFKSKDAAQAPKKERFELAERC
jgi:hypothetical protein